MKRLAIIYDGHDVDGKLSAAIAQVHNRDAKEIKFYPTYPGDTKHHQEITHEIFMSDYTHVIMCDISFDPELMQILNSLEFLWFDHHKSVEDMFGGPGLQKIGFAACGLIWSYYNSGADHIDPPLFLECAAAYDVFKNPNSEFFNQTVLPIQCAMETFKSVRSFIRLLEEDWNNATGSLYGLGKILWEEQKEFIMGLDIQPVHLTGRLKQYDLIHVGSPITVTAGRIAHVLRQSGMFTNADFMVTQRWNEEKEMYTHSLRSMNDTANCLELIEDCQLLGGGHEKAAGFRHSMDLFPELQSV